MNALESLHDASRTGKRNQTILTPEWLTALLVEEWGSIAMDVCAESYDGLVPADVHITEAENGLVVPWADKSYGNVPFGKTKLWLAKARAERDTGNRVALLVPVRTHRPWWRLAVRTCTALVELNAFAFRGYKATFPAPIALLCWNWTPSQKLWAARGDVRCPGA